MVDLPRPFSDDDTQQNSENDTETQNTNESVEDESTLETQAKLMYSRFESVSEFTVNKLNAFLSLLSINIATLKLTNEKGSLNYYFDMFWVGVFTILYKLYVFGRQKLLQLYGKITRQEVDTSREYPPHWGLLSFDRYGDVKALLKELNYPITIDIWVARVYGLGSILGFIMGVMGYWIGSLIAPLLIEVEFGLEGIPIWVRIWAEQNVELVVIPTLALVMATFGVFFVYIAFKQWISYRVREKERRIDAIFPQGVKYQYALAESGASVKDIIYLTAKQTKNYGEFANEMRYVVKYVEIDNMNLGDAVEQRANETQSKDVEQLLKQFAVVLESGTEPVEILRNRYQRSIEIKEESQERTLELQEVVVEMLLNITAGIIFFLIIAMIMSLLGASLETVSIALVFGGVPMLGIIIAYLLRFAKRRTEIIDVQIPKEYEYNPHEYARPKEMQRELDSIPERPIHESTLEAKEHKISKQLVYYYRYISATLFSPLKQMENNPLTALIISIPAALMYMVFISGFASLTVTELGMTIPVPFTIDSLQPQPITAWIGQVGIPVFIALIPPAIFHDLKTRREANIFAGLSTMMAALQQASSTGQTIEESLRDQGANLNADLQEVLRRAKNTLSWFGDIETTIKDMNNEISVPEFTRTTTMITDSISLSGNITETLDVAAEDLRRSYELKQSAKASGTASVVMLLFVYALVGGILLVMLYMFFPIMSEAFPEGGTAELGFGGSFKVDFYTVIMVSALYNLSIVLGMIAGQFRANHVLSGIKYSLGLTLLTAITLLFFEFDIMSMLG